VNDHPNLDLLKNYLNNSKAAEFNSLRLHLAQCSQCRTLVDGLTGLKSICQQPKNDTLNEQQHQQISDYIHHRLDTVEAQQIKELINSDTSAMKAALHYASHKSSVERTMDLNKASSTSSMQAALIFNKLKSLLSFKSPIWISVPVTIAFIALLSFNLFNLSPPEQPPYTIANYQDNPIIQFRSKESLPGIGFFKQSDQLSKNYNGLQVSVSDDNHLTLRWPPVSNATKYTLHLHIFEKGNKIVLADITTKNSFANISLNLQTIFHRYEWELSGETHDDRVFIANGGFVINDSNKGNLR